jgi:HEAT repeat protein
MKTPTIKQIALVTVVIVAAVLVAGFAADIHAQDSNKEAEKLYKEARRALNGDEYKKAAGKFESVHKKYPESKYAAEAMYWQAFSLYRIESKSSLKDAQRVLEKQFDQYARSDTYDDARSLYYRVLGKLAEMGDSEAARKVSELENEWEIDRNDDRDCDLEEKMAALHALLNMNPNRAYTILEKMYNNPKTDPCSAEMREQALFILSQVDDDDAVDLLVHIAKNDPGAEVREQAVFWLAQTGSSKATDVLVDILENSDDPALQEKAIFSLSQIGDSRALEALRTVAMDESKDDELRANAIFWLGQGGGLDDIEFLKEMFERLEDAELKVKILFSVAQNGGRSGGKWLMSVVADEKEDVEVRKQALFWAGQTDAVDVDGIVKVYKSSKDRELRDQAVFALSQRDNRESVRAMIELARGEKDADLRKNLLFWIGQSDHPEAEEYLLEVINN